MSWYRLHPWLHYLQEEDAVLCFFCATAVQHKMPLTGYVDNVFSKSGFSNWQKALEKFRKHEQSICHRETTVMCYNSIMMILMLTL